MKLIDMVSLVCLSPIRWAMNCCLGVSDIEFVDTRKGNLSHPDIEANIAGLKAKTG